MRGREDTIHSTGIKLLRLDKYILGLPSTSRRGEGFGNERRDGVRKYPLEKHPESLTVSGEL